jgi:hypothetical protein
MALGSPYRRIKPARVIISMADGQVFDGTVNLGFEERVSDVLMDSKPFVAMFDVNDGKAVKIVNKAQIVAVEPKDESQTFIDRDL